MQAKPSVYTLAAELGIAPSTVSRALHNSPKISAERRKQIRKLATQHGFSPRAFSPRTTHIGAVICTSDARDNFFSSYTEPVINGLNDYCADSGIVLSIFALPLPRLNRIDVLKELLRCDMSGAVLINATDGCRFLAQLEGGGFPYCCLLNAPSKFEHRVLAIDQRGSAMKAVQYLIQLGHRRIGFLYSTPGTRVHMDRLDGYREALRGAGLPADETLHPTPSPGISGIEYGFWAAQQLIAGDSPVTAILAVDHDLAEGAASAIARSGRSIPGDISLVGWDDSPHAAYFNPPLTLVDIPNRRLGRAAAQWVHAQIKDDRAPAPPHEPWMEAKLIVRESAAPPRSRH